MLRLTLFLLSENYSRYKLDNVKNSENVNQSVTVDQPVFPKHALSNKQKKTKIEVKYTRSAFFCIKNNNKTGTFLC